MNGEPRKDTGDAPAVFDEGYYTANYGDYERQNPPRKSRHYLRLIEKHRSPDTPRRIHDVGCGMGVFLSRLGEAWEVCGSDPSEFAVEQARRRVPRGSFRVGTVTAGAGATEPAFSGEFGVVTALDVLEHVPDLEAAAAAIRRQLARRGILLFVVPVYDGPLGGLVRWLDRDPTHVHKWPRRRWLEWAAAHFEVLDWSGALRYLLPGIRYYVYVPTRRFRGLAPAIAVMCRRRSP